MEGFGERLCPEGKDVLRALTKVISMCRDIEKFRDVEARICKPGAVGAGVSEEE